jgi:PhnB protein
MSSLPNLAPWLNVRGSEQAVEFYKAAFGAEVRYLLEADGVVARLAIGATEFWLSDESPDHDNPSPESLNGSTIRLILSVDDPDAAFQRACEAGAKPVCPVKDDHGWRVGRVLDPFGHSWEIARPPAE